MIHICILPVRSDEKTISPVPPPSWGVIGMGVFVGVSFGVSTNSGTEVESATEAIVEVGGMLVGGTSGVLVAGTGVAVSA
jgi:hypothetical protein